MFILTLSWILFRGTVTRYQSSGIAIAIPVLGEELHRYHLVPFAIVTIGNAVSVRGRKLPKPRPEILKRNSYEYS